jgi:hypothetical protein
MSTIQVRTEIAVQSTDATGFEPMGLTREQSRLSQDKVPFDDQVPCSLLNKNQHSIVYKTIQECNKLDTLS